MRPNCLLSFEGTLEIGSSWRPRFARRLELQFPTVRGERPPLVDVADRATLFDRADEGPGQCGNE
jgi:hypothetical protein